MIEIKYEVVEPGVGKTITYIYVRDILNSGKCPDSEINFEINSCIYHLHRDQMA